MEDDIKDILNGKHVPVNHILNYRSEEVFKTLPVVKRNVCYICCTVLFDDEGRVLLVQEAKPSCYGQWYLPAGRLEPGETIVDGAKREVKEEAGLECDLTTLVCVELNGVWMRFTFAGVVTGGNLKTSNEKDKESLQAKFFYLQELPNPLRPTKLRMNSSLSSGQGGSCVLRCDDILNLIEIARRHKEKKNHAECLPVIHPHKYISHRFVIVDRCNASSMNMLTSKKGDSLHMPAALGNVKQHVQIHDMIHSILNVALSAHSSESSFEICGLLGLEHRGTGEMEDGICITHLVNLNLTEEQGLPDVASTEYCWYSITCSHLQTRLKDGCHKKIVPSNSLPI